MSDAQPKLPRFSDFAEKDGSLDGTKIKLDDVLNKEITVLDFRVAASKYQRNNTSEYLTIQFEFTDAPGVHHVIFTGSTVLTKTLQQYKDKLPFITVIRKVDKFYKFT